MKKYRIETPSGGIYDSCYAESPEAALDKCGMLRDPKLKSFYKAVPVEEGPDATCGMRTVLIVDKDFGNEPDFFITIPETVTAKKVQKVIDNMESNLPGEYTDADLAAALHDAFGFYPQKINLKKDVVCW